MEYKIISESGNIDKELVYDRLEKEVNEYIKNGWRPFGGINVISLTSPENCENGSYIEVWQPMIKEINNE